MTNPPQTTPPSAPIPPATKPSVATLSRELSDFLVEFSITLNKHVIYPLKHPLLDIAIDGVAHRLALLFDENREALSIGVARRQLIIEGVATDPHNPVLKELAQKLHNHHVGALKFIRGIEREELAEHHRAAQQAGQSLPRLALEFALAQPGVSVALVGMRTETHLRDCLSYLCQSPE